MGEQGEGRWLMGLSGSREPGKGKTFEMLKKYILNKKIKIIKIKIKKRESRQSKPEEASQ